MEEKCYKVVHEQENGKLVSCIAECGLELTYSTREATLPVIGKIFIFKTLEAAKNFRGNNSQMEIWSALATDVKRYRKKQIVHWNHLDTESARNFWEHGSFPIGIWSGIEQRGNVPAGTYTASSLILLEKVDG